MNYGRIIRYLFLSVMLGVICSSLNSFADTISLVLASPTRTGNMLAYDATVSAAGANAGAVFLNSDSFSISSPLTLDDAGFFSFPLSLDPGGSYTGLLFTVAIPSGTPLGAYFGSFSILGGSDPLASDLLATSNFQAAVLPEPGTIVLLATGLSGIAGLIRRRVRCPLPAILREPTAVRVSYSPFRSKAVTE